MSKTKNNNASTAEFLGFEGFGKFGLLANGREIVFFAVAPSNIAVLSDGSVERKVDKLSAMLTAFPEIEILAIDGCECFDDNKIFLNSRIEAESSEVIRQLLQKDSEHLDSIQSDMSNSRQFFITYKFYKQTDDMIGIVTTRLEKALTEHDFVSHRLDKREIKQLLAVYFGISNYGDMIPDFELEGAIK